MCKLRQAGVLGVGLLAARGAVACQDPVESGPDPDVVAIRQLITTWETAMERDDEAALKAVFVASYWPQSRSWHYFPSIGGHSLKVVDIEIGIGVQGDVADARFGFRDATSPWSGTIHWELSRHGSWLVSYEVRASESN